MWELAPLVRQSPHAPPALRIASHVPPATAVLQNSREHSLAGDWRRPSPHRRRFSLKRCVAAAAIAARYSAAFELHARTCKTGTLIRLRALYVNLVKSAPAQGSKVRPFTASIQAWPDCAGNAIHPRRSAWWDRWKQQRKSRPTSAATRAGRLPCEIARRRRTSPHPLEAVRHLPQYL